MYILYGIISAVLSSILFGYVGYERCKKKIEVKHEINPHEWVLIYLFVSPISILLISLSELWTDKTSGITFMSYGWKGIAYLFIRNGGLLIPVMAILSWMYNVVIQRSEYKYFIKRHQWIKKFYFSVICITFPIECCLIIGKTKQNNILLDAKCDYMVTWIIIFLEIWFGFDMGSGILHYRKKSERRCAKLPDNEMKNMVWCLSSMFLFPIVLIVWILIKTRTPASIQSTIIAVISGFILGMLMMLFVIVGDICMHCPSKARSMTKFDKAFERIGESFKTGYFSRVKYVLEEKEEGVILQICRESISIEESDKYSQLFLEKFKRVFDSDKILYLFQDYDREEIKNIIENKLEKIADERNEMLQEAWNIAYKICDDREKGLY